MAEPVIRLDQSRAYSENRGEMRPDDPHYRVAFFQGEPLKVIRNGKPATIAVTLPFDAQGDLVPDDGKQTPWEGLDSDGKKVIHHPLWNDDMRELLARKKRRLAAAMARAQGQVAAAAVIDEDEDGDTGPEPNDGLDVNFAAWLRGQTEYEWPELQVAAKHRYFINYTSKQQMVHDLVLDHFVVRPEEVCGKLARHLPPPADASAPNAGASIA